MSLIRLRHLTLTFFTFAVLYILPLAQARSVLPPSFSSFIELTIGRQDYTAVVISPTDEPGPTPYSLIPEGESELAEYIEEEAENWYISRIREFHPDIPGPFLRNLKEESRKARKRSGLIVVMKNRDLKQIQFTLRYVWTTEADPLLPSETQFNIRFPQPALKLGEYPQMQSPMTRRSPLVTIPALIGDFDEMKMYAHAENADLDFSPLAFILGEVSGASNRFQIRTPNTVLAVPKLIESASFLGGHFLTTHEKLEPLYRRLGFYRIEIEGLPKPNIAMQMTRNEFFGKFRNRIESLRSYEAITSAKWTDRQSELGPDLETMTETARSFGLDLNYLKCVHGLRTYPRPEIWKNLPPGVSIRARAIPGHLIHAPH